ncbi:MAG: hypothetical protein HY673_10250 [Chloroflexi bacterium]|nr:hypothetical protein [Chloroflexota bacterium]
MPQYEALVHVLWELPFPLRLPPVAFFCWEPGEGVALFDPRPEVGELAWKRRSGFLQAAEVFAEPGLSNECYPTHDYHITSELRSGREIKTALLTCGPAGGFAEARPYTVANIFLCLRQRADYVSAAVLERADDALNNILDVYRFVTMDPLARSVRADHDCYYTLVSVADLPPEVGEIEPRSALQMVACLSFGSVIGMNRAHHVGLNSFDDLLAGEIIPSDVLRLFDFLISAPHDLELFHQLIFSAIRRLKRNEHALAVLDAQSALESLVAVLVVENLTRQGKTLQQIEAEMAPGGRFHTLQRRLEELDRIAVTQTPSSAQPRRFLSSPEEAQWRTALYGLRNRIVHEGLRTVPFVDAKAALVAGLHAIYRIQDLAHPFGRAMIWSGATLDLGHIQQSAGRISRLFEA